MNKLIENLSAEIKAKIGKKKPQIAIVLGTGLGKFADNLTDSVCINYKDIKGFPCSTVVGHKGCLVVGKIGKTEVLCLQGRFHLYEGLDAAVIRNVILALKQLGIQEIIITNAAGSLNKKMPAGSLMIIKDHINFSARNPLISDNPEDKPDNPFVDMSDAYCSNCRKIIKKLAAKHKIKLFEGIYFMVLGPNFETAAEVKAFKKLGADAVGMSTVPEVISSVYAGLKVVGFSVITNMATGLSREIQKHEDVIKAGDDAGEKLNKLINLYLESK